MGGFAAFDLLIYAVKSGHFFFPSVAAAFSMWYNGFDYGSFWRFEGKGGVFVAKLTPRQQRFIEEYMIDLNATQAYIRAGYEPIGAEVSACKLLSNPKIRQAVDKLRAIESRRTGITVDRILREYAKIAFADISDLADLDQAEVYGDATRQDTAAIQSIKLKRTKTGRDVEIEEREVKLYDKQRALDSLLKHLAPTEGGGALPEGMAGRLGVVLLPAVDPEPEPPVDELGADEDEG